MNIKRFLSVIAFLYIVTTLYSQDYQVTSPKLDFDGRQLTISYDILTKSPKDKFYIWVETKRRNGDTIRMRNISGDIGSFISAGNNKRIFWIPEADSIFLNEEIFTEVKAEKHIKTFSKGHMMFLSTLFPGWGQTKISEGKPWWLLGLATYGTIAGGYYIYSDYQKTYDAYLIESDPVVRDALFNESQKKLNTAGIMLITGAAVWASNILWVAVTPNPYLPLKHVNISFERGTGAFSGASLVTMKINF